MVVEKCKKKRSATAQDLEPGTPPERDVPFEGAYGTGKKDCPSSPTAARRTITKDEATKYAKKAVAILRRDAVAFAKKHGASAMPRTFGLSVSELMKMLEIEVVSWDQRSRVKGALTRALKEAEVLGLIECQSRYGFENVWVYVGPEIKVAIQKYNERVARERKALIVSLRALGIFIMPPKGVHGPEDWLAIRVRHIHEAAARIRKIKENSDG